MSCFPASVSFIPVPRAQPYDQQQPRGMWLPSKIKNTTAFFFHRSASNLYELIILKTIAKKYCFFLVINAPSCLSILPTNYLVIIQSFIGKIWCFSCSQMHVCYISHRLFVFHVSFFSFSLHCLEHQRWKTNTSALGIVSPWIALRPCSPPSAFPFHPAPSSTPGSLFLGSPDSSTHNSPRDTTPTPCSH